MKKDFFSSNIAGAILLSAVFCGCAGVTENMNKTENVQISVDFKEGDTVAVIAGVWKDTVGVVQRMDFGKHTATINVEMFGRETPVEISFAEIKSM